MSPNKNDVYQAVWPPSTFKSAPVMKLLPSARRNIIGARYSSVADMRFSMFSADHSCSCVGLDRDSAVSGVLIYPGLIVFTLIEGNPGRPPHSAARERPSWRTADLEELYAAVSSPWLFQRVRYGPQACLFNCQANNVWKFMPC